jgi:hypothetical protein
MTTANRTTTRPTLDAGLILRIDGRDYAISYLEPGHTLDLEYRRPGALDPTAYSLGIDPDNEPGDVCKGGASCTCPDFQRRHAGTGSLGCKHIRAARATGLLPNA